MKKILMIFAMAAFVMMISCDMKAGGVAEEQLANAKGSENGELSGQYYPGYVITKPIDVSLSKSCKQYDSKIEAGKVCVKGCAIPSENEFPNEYRFALVDARETVFIEKNFITYYAPAQEDITARYAKTTIFNQSAKKVNIYINAPVSWQNGGVKTLIPKIKTDIEKVTVKPITIKDKNATYEFNGTKTSLYNKTVFEVTFFYNGDQYTEYAYNGQRLNNMMEPIIINDNGFAFIDDDSKPAKPCTEFGVYALGIALFGWITPTQMVINDMAYDVTE